MADGTLTHTWHAETAGTAVREVGCVAGAAHQIQHLSNTGLCCAAKLTLLAEYNVFYRTTADPPMPTPQSTLRIELVRLSRNNSPNLRFPLPWIAAGRLQQRHTRNTPYNLQRSNRPAAMSL